MRLLGSWCFIWTFKPWGLFWISLAPTLSWDHKCVDGILLVVKLHAFSKRFIKCKAWKTKWLKSFKVFYVLFYKKEHFPDGKKKNGMIIRDWSKVSTQSNGSAKEALSENIFTNPSNESMQWDLTKQMVITTEYVQNGMPVGASVNVSPVQDVVLASRQCHIHGKMPLELGPLEGTSGLRTCISSIRNWWLFGQGYLKSSVFLKPSLIILYYMSNCF